MGLPSDQIGKKNSFRDGVARQVLNLKTARVKMDPR